MGDLCRRIAPVMEAAPSSLCIQQIDRRTVGHEVTRCAAFAGQALVPDVIRSVERIERLLRPSESKEMFIEERDVPFEDGRRVALWINGNKRDDDAVGLSAEHTIGTSEFCHGRRADVRTMGVSEEQDQDFPPLGHQAERTPVLVSELHIRRGRTGWNIRSIKGNRWPSSLDNKPNSSRDEHERQKCEADDDGR